VVDGLALPRARLLLSMGLTEHVQTHAPVLKEHDNDDTRNH
jgi:hypothetical protein